MAPLPPPPERQRPGFPAVRSGRGSGPPTQFPPFRTGAAPQGPARSGTMPFLPGDGPPHSSSSPGPSPGVGLCTAPARPPEPPATSGSEAERRRGHELGAQRTGARAELDSSGLSPDPAGSLTRTGGAGPRPPPALTPPDAAGPREARPRAAPGDPTASRAPPTPLGRKSGPASPAAPYWARRQGLAAGRPPSGQATPANPKTGTRSRAAETYGRTREAGRSEGRGAPGRQAGLPPRDPEVPALPLVGVVVRPWLGGARGSCAVHRGLFHICNNR